VIRRVALVLSLAVGTVACENIPEAPPLPPNTFAFGVFADGPYRAWEEGRFHRLLADVSATDVQWLMHIGDLLWFPCSDAALSGRLDMLNSVRHPVVYTPGDNEWTDCHGRVEGEYDPLDRLAFIRRTFFARPAQSLGTPPIPVETQSSDPAWKEFVENTRWRRGGFLFATLHVVGSGNASEPYAGRTAASDSESVRRMKAALAWLDAAFDAATRDSLSGVVLAIHADPYFENPPSQVGPFTELVARLARRTAAFRGEVLFIHGDSHEYTEDDPLHLPNFRRFEAFGSPDIGWARVIVDSVAGKIVRIEPRLMPRHVLFW